jgi:hypothetical protein
MKPWKTLAGLAAFVLMVSCDMGTPPQANGGGTEVEGVIVDQHGKPAANIWVRVYPDTSLSLAKGSEANAAFQAIRDSARTNASGAFRLPNLPSGTYNLVASLRRNDTTMTLFRRSIVVSGNLNLGTDTLRVAGSLTLNVSLQGSSIGGAVCQIPGSPFLTVSDLAGLCTLTGLPPGVYQVSVSVAGLPHGTTAPVTVLSLQVTPAGTLNLEWGSGPVLTPPVLASPANNGEALGSAELIWNAVSAATSYDVQVSTDSLFSTLIVSDTARAGLSRHVGVANGTVYRWRVRARNGQSVSNWSAAWKFTGKTTPLDCIISSSEAPVLASPAHLAHVAPPVSLSWGSTCGGSLYRVQVARDSAFSLLAYQNDSVAALTVTAGLSPAAATYHWRVSARLSNGTWAAWSPARIFIADSSAGLGTPILGSPANGATGLSTTTTVTWSNTVSGALSYRLHLSTDSMFSTLTRADTLTTMTLSTVASKTYTNLEAGRTYYWRVIAVGSSRTSTSETRRFTTASLVDSVRLTAPVDFAINWSRLPTFTWNAASGAMLYHIQVSTVSSFATVAFSDSMVTGTSKTGFALNATSTYYWRVRGRAGSSPGSLNGAWSAVRQLTTGNTGLPPTPPAAPVPLAPKNDTVLETTTPGLVWSASAGATGYRVQLATDSMFNTLLVNDSVSETGHPAGTLTVGTRYFWRVYAYNGALMSAASAVAKFSVNAPLSVPALVAPAANATEVSVTPTLSWAAVSGATSYGLQVSTSPSFASTVYDQGVAGGATSRAISGLAANTQYYWRVNARSNVNQSAYSQARSFTTGASTWASHVSGTSGALYAFATGRDSIAIAAGRAGQILTSINGTTWMVRTTPFAGDLYGVAWGGNQFVAVGDSGAVLTSPTGVNWTRRTTPTTTALNAVTWDGVQFIAVGNAGTALYSADGITWQAQATGTAQNLYFITVGGGKVLAGGAGGALLTSPSGTGSPTWTVRTSGTSATLAGGTWTGSQFAIVGAAGHVATSADGISWTPRTSGSSVMLYAIAWNGSLLKAVGNAGTALTSANNGLTWTAEATGSPAAMYALGKYKTLWMALGAGGTILTTP